MSEFDGERLAVFLHDNLWEDESSGFVCNGNARLILEQAISEFGVGGKIWEVFAGVEPADIDVSHSYVVLEIQRALDNALNQQKGTRLRTVAEVVRRGVDITEEILNTPWDMLR